MDIQPAKNMLDSINPLEIEKSYQSFYIHCEKAKYQTQDSANLADYITSIYKTSPNEQIKSYCFLFLGALLDTTTISAQTANQIHNFIIQQAEKIDNFEALNDNNGFVHFLNHMLVCADALVSATSSTQKQSLKLINALLTAYLRADIAFGFNEDILLAELILMSKIAPSEFQQILQKLAPSDAFKGENIRQFAAKEANKRHLWMTMLALNHQFKIHPTNMFDGLISKTTQQFFD